MPLIDRITLPFDTALRAERVRLIETLEKLSDEDFTSGPTLCAGWSPRDILGHLIGVDYLLGSYLPYGLRVTAANQGQVERVRRMPRHRLMEWARHWAASPSPTSRLGGLLILGDLAIHHQDIVRGLGLHREVPDETATAIFREGLQLSLWTNRRVVRHRLVPTDGHRPFALPAARDGDVHGTREALGMWLAGRDSVAGELRFA
ncbi:maleylpyruvate isomerase family mycothiol-dependent enzyme [Actinomadura sp. SCN-SB]|uniref:maleylpyruvate isomerase family mycothiol-dependent enzyme n=1 Tax=Actinomadura sp. SCN-SB TaxID=3373092 RepID=UPI00374FDE0E